MKLPSPALFRSNYFWTCLAAFFSLVVCTTLFYLRTEQSRTILDGASTIRNIGQARIDLNEGFLHLTLASEPRSPFRSEEGLALIGQAVGALRQVREEGVAGHPLNPAPNGPWRDFDKTAATFSSQLDVWKRTPESDRAAIALPMHLAFHQLEQYASQMDEASEAKLMEINTALSRTFLVATCISTFLLCGLCVGVYWAGRNQRIAAEALRRSEERLRILGDNLPGGYIFEFRRSADGTPRFAYISAGVEQVNGVKAADCMRDPALLFGQMDPEQLKAHDDAETRCSRDLSDYSMDAAFRHPNGKDRVIRILSHPVADSRGITWYGVTLDITETRRAEAKMRKNEALLEEMGRTAKIGGWEYDFETEDGEWTEEHFRIFELPPGVSPTRKMFLSFYEEGSRERIEAARAKAIAEGSSYDLELEIVSARGTHKWVRILGHPVFENGKVVCLRGSTQDITDLKAAEETARRQQQNYREIFNAVADAIFVQDTVTGRVIDVNGAMLKMYGFATKEEFLTASDSIFAEPPYAKADGQQLVRKVVKEGPQVAEWQMRRKNGELFWVEVSLHNARIDGRERILASVRDITLRKENELEIERLTRLYSTLSEVNQTIVRCREREELFERICQVMTEFGKFRGVWIGMKPEGSDSLNVIAQRLTGKGADEALNAGTLGCSGTIRNMLKTGEPVICSAPGNICARCPRKLLAKIQIFACASFPLRLNKKLVGAFTLFSGESNFFNPGEVRLLNEIADDISFALDRMDEREQQRQIQAERLRITTAIEQAAELITITDLKGNILYVNPAFEQVTGYTREEVLGQNPRILKSGKMENSFYASLWTTLAQGNVWHGHFINRKKSGELYEEDATISPVRNASGEITNFVAVKRDITREVALEAQFRQAQKMEAIGQLAGGVAHDFNNILGAILLQAQVTEHTREIPLEAVEGVRQIQRSCERGANLTRQLLLFGRRQEMQPRDLDLNEIVNNITKMLQRIIGENITMQLRLNSAPLITRADAGMLDQVIMNLAINGRDAMEGRGRLTIETSVKKVSATAAAPNPEAAPGDYACLAISDTGSGIPPEILPRIYEPFFTTKEQGKGTGLGLATVFGIVKQHKGWIDIKTARDKGTTFKVYLPLGRTAPEAEAGNAGLPASTAGSETILLAEDDPEVRKITRKFLELHGYNVLEARNGVEALDIWKKERGKVDLLLTDLLMPDGVNGYDLARRLHAASPGLKIVFMSGYSGDLTGQGLELRPGENFLQKPVQPDQLLALLRAQLA